MSYKDEDYEWEWGVETNEFGNDRKCFKSKAWKPIRKERKRNFTSLRSKDSWKNNISWICSWEIEVVKMD